MLLTYWGLDVSPFRNPSDGGWLYESPPHDEALSRLLFVIQERHCCGLLCGPAGTGKSLLLATVAARASRMSRATASIDLAGLDAESFVWQLASGLRRAPRAGDLPSQWWRDLDDYLAGSRLSRQHAVVLLDHADTALPECREEVKRLVHLADRSAGGLTVLLALRGQVWPEWCGQLRRFATVRIDVSPLDSRETARYVAESLRRAGCDRDLFPPESVDAIHQRTRGIPRHVNRLCEVSLLAAMSDNRERVDPEVVHAAAQELEC